MAEPVSLVEVLSEVPDLGGAQGLRHPLPSVLSLTVLAVLAGMRGPESIAQFGRDHGSRLAWNRSRRAASGAWRCLRQPCRPLWTHKAAMLAEGLASVPWVFCDTQGGPLRKSNVERRVWKPIRTAANLPPVRFHDLRHTAATLLLSQNVHPKIVQERLGHSKISLTLDTYSHILPGMQQEASDKLDRMLG